MLAAVPYRLYNDLIRHGIDDRDLYRCAANDVSEPGLQVVFQETAASLGAMIDDLQHQVRDSGHRPARHGTLAGGVRRWLLGRRGGYNARRCDECWIARLLRSESELLNAVERRIDRVTPDAALVLRRQLPRLYGIHMDMSSLAQVSH